MKILKSLILTLLLVVNFSFAEEDMQQKKVVIDLTTGSFDKIEKYILNSIVKHHDYYYSNFEDLKVVVVIHGESYKFFIEDLKNSPYKDDKELQKIQSDLGKRLKSLVENYGVKFEICSAGMGYRKIEAKTLYPFVTPIFTTFTGIVDWQSKGYAYFPIK